MKELIIKVEGMHCGGCENRIQNAVGAIEGVQEVVANHEDGTVKVIANNEIDSKVITEAIEDIGFDVKEN